MALINIRDGAASLIAAIVTAAICGIPAWFTWVGYSAGIVPIWGLAAAGLLVVVGAVMIGAFLRKMAGGVAPSRTRRR